MVRFGGRGMRSLPRPLDVAATLPRYTTLCIWIWIRAGKRVSLSWVVHCSSSVGQEKKKMERLPFAELSCGVGVGTSSSEARREQGIAVKTRDSSGESWPGRSARQAWSGLVRSGQVRVGFRYTDTRSRSEALLRDPAKAGDGRDVVSALP